MLRFRYIHGYSWKAVAEDLSRSESTARTYGMRGLELLQQYLDERKQGGAA